MNVRITEHLEIDLKHEHWCCNRCAAPLGDARKNYKEGCLVAERPMEEVHDPLLADGELSFCFDPDYCCLLEFYCPACGLLIENEYLPPGHPITHDLELDIDALKRKHDGRG